MHVRKVKVERGWAKTRTYSQNQHHDKKSKRCRLWTSHTKRYICIQFIQRQTKEKNEKSIHNTQNP